MGFLTMVSRPSIDWISYLEINFYGEEFFIYKPKHMGFFCVEA